MRPETKSATALPLIDGEPFETKATTATARRPIAIVTGDGAADEFAMRVSGYAATWDPDLGGDLITRGAFREGLAAWRASGEPIQFVDFHNYTGLKKILGRLVDAHEDEVGLSATFGVVRTQETEHARELVRTKSITGLSIGYRVPRGGSREPDAAQRALGVTRVLTRIALHEVSLVMSPMNPQARVTSPEGKADALASDFEQRRERFRSIARDRIAEQAAERAEQFARLKALRAELDRDALKPDDPKRIEMSAQLRSLRRRRLLIGIA